MSLTATLSQFPVRLAVFGITTISACTFLYHTCDVHKINPMGTTWIIGIATFGLIGFGMIFMTPCVHPDYQKLTTLLVCTIPIILGSTCIALKWKGIEECPVSREVMIGAGVASIIGFLVGMIIFSYLKSSEVEWIQQDESAPTKTKVKITVQGENNEKDIDLQN